MPKLKVLKATLKDEIRETTNLKKKVRKYPYLKVLLNRQNANLGILRKKIKKARKK